MQIVNIGQNVIIEGIFQNLIQVQKDQKKGAQALLATSIFHILSVVNFKILNYNDRENPILLKINEAKEILNEAGFVYIDTEKELERQKKFKARLESYVEDINGGDNFADYCEDFFELLEEEGYYD